MTTNPPKQPSHRLFTVKGENDNATWVSIGAAWPNRDGHGFTLVLDALPIDGRIVMRDVAERENGGSQ